jgi:hypothetical protein
MSGQAPRYARVPAETGRAGWQRDAEHTATAGALQGRGTSQAGALAALGEALAAMASRASDAPMFGWDAPNRTLWVAVPDAHHGGSVHYIVHFDESGNPSVSGSTTLDRSPAREAWQSSEGITRLPSPFYRDAR